MASGEGSESAPVNGIIPDPCPEMGAPWLRDHSLLDLVEPDAPAKPSIPDEFQRWQPICWYALGNWSGPFGSRKPRAGDFQERS